MAAHGGPVPEPGGQGPDEDGSPPSRRVWGRALLLLIGAAALYILTPRILDLWDEVPRVTTIGWFGLGAMLVFESLSFVATWRLHRLVMPELTWFSAGTAQLSANAVSRSLPGGAAIGAGVQLRMWTKAGVEPAQAGTAMAATSLISTATLLSIPIVALAVAVLGAPVPRNLTVVAIGGAVLAAALFAFGTRVLVDERFARAVATGVHRLVGAVGRRFDRTGPSVDTLLSERADLLAALGPRWRSALVASVANWGFDYLVLASALVFLDANPRFSVVLLAYAAAAVLAMIPITPGGFGFVEAGLASLLVVAGVPGHDALLATLAYRVASFWLPLPAGLVAWLLARHRYEREGAG